LILRVDNLWLLGHGVAGLSQLPDGLVGIFLFLNLDESIIGPHVDVVGLLVHHLLYAQVDLVKTVRNSVAGVK
jgi:hypothetical protein